MPIETARRFATPATVAAVTVLAALTALVSGCATAQRTTEVEPSAVAEPEPDCTVPAMEEPASPAEPECADDVLTAYDGLLILAPHPDDEALGFAGLVSAYLEQGKPVRAVVVTDGDAYCGACRLWKASSFRGSPCGAADLSNFATPEVDSFAEVRRGESTAAAAVLGLPAPEFLGYPDTGLAAAWRNLDLGEPEKPLRRSDFSHCTETCATCEGGYGEGPVTELSLATLIEALNAELAATSERTLLATTHWLDGHGDHAALGRFVHALNSELPQPRAVAYAVIHAHTPKDAPHADCWYPAPRSPLCQCMTEECNLGDPDRVATVAAYRFRPEWPAALPDDADYGPERQLCLPERLWRGEEAVKLRAVRSYPSQLGSLARNGSHPEGLAGAMDCSGYLISFVRRTEAFVLVEPGTPINDFSER
jgi:LmbE family N-acetylglucosaminyl deacetylase